MRSKSGWIVAGLMILLVQVAVPLWSRPESLGMPGNGLNATAAIAEEDSARSQDRAAKPRLTAAQKAEIKKIAGMIVKGEPESKVKKRWSAYCRKHIFSPETKASAQKYDSDTEGAESRAADSSLEAMEHQVLKEMSETEKDKAEEILEAQRKHIEKMMEMIRETTERLSESTDDSSPRGDDRMSRSLGSWGHDTDSAGAPVSDEDCAPPYWAWHTHGTLVRNKRPHCAMRDNKTIPANLLILL